MEKIPVATRFWSKVDIRGEDECWDWKATTSGKRYGWFRYSKKETYAHRVSYILSFGSIPLGVYVLHKCDNSLCVNPRHLYLGTQKDNVADMIARGRVNNVASKGEKNGRAILSKKNVLDIKESHRNGATTKSLAEKYGVGHVAIWRAWAGISWKHLTNI